MNYKVHDIHAHIIYGVDDGARDLNMSLEMLNMAYAQGTQSIICTSHDGFDAHDYSSKMKCLQYHAHNNNINVRLFTGCEIYCSKKYINDIIVEIINNTILTMNKTQYVLTEFSPHATSKEIIYCVKMLAMYGYKAIIAHMERYCNAFEDNGFADNVYKLGGLIQINAYSLVDETNNYIKYYARKLLKETRVTFIGSDAHRTDHRSYIIKNGVDYIYKHCDTEYAQNICYRNAEKILNIK